jgi:hypothetical protein
MVRQSVTRQARHARRTSGRILASALGFGVAYYLDAENGAARRRRVHDYVSRTARDIDGVLTRDFDEPPPVFYPLLRSLAMETPMSEPRRAGAR